MSREHAFKVEGKVIEVLPNQTCRVELSNGHRVRGYATGKNRPAISRLRVGETVLLELSPYDLSEGRILLSEQV